MQIAPASFFEHCANFDPAAPLDAFLESIPAKWVVYLFADADGTAFQLLCVKNLRASLQRRLGTETELAPGRRVPYRQVVRSVWWQRVDSTFEADLVYAAAASQFFPAARTHLLDSRRPWFIEITPDAPHPRFTRTDQPRPRRDRCLFGPLPSRAGAQRVIEQLEDAFDLCRYYNILVQSPRGLACPYKQMHKCPAPCDGSVSLPAYHQMVQQALDFLASPSEVIAAHTQRMQAAAAELLFEDASRIKSHIQKLTDLASLGLRPLDQMEFLVVGRGSRAGQAKLWYGSPMAIEPLACLLSVDACPNELADLLDQCRAAAARQWDTACLDRLTQLSHAILGASADHALIPLAGFAPCQLAAAARQVQRRRNEPDQSPADEGIIRENGTA